jgi:KaiC/GvpD/RAD55 family RecA-like ATPase
VTINPLDPSQKQALASVTSAGADQDLFLIYGPPGTGKSQLLVSMLFELALKGKKVLFVSQNTEALRVIERMISKLEKEMTLPASHLSLDDFCLKLYSKDHRLLKYIRGQLGRLQDSRSSEEFNDNGRDFGESGMHLGYTNLGWVENNQTQGRLGIDELLRYMLKYVRAHMVQEPVYTLQNINVRQVFELLDNYENAENFNNLTHPQNALRFASAVNPDLLIDHLTSHYILVRDLIDENLITPVARHELDLFQYLSSLQAYYSLASTINLYALQQHGLTPKDLSEALSGVVRRSTSVLSPVDVLKGLENVSEPVFDNKRHIAHLEDDQGQRFNDCLQFVVDVVSELRSLHASATDYKVKPLIASALTDTFVDIGQLVSSIPETGSLTSQHLEMLLSEYKEHSAKGGLKRVFAGIPPSFKSLFGEKAKDAHKAIAECEKELEQVKLLINGTNLTLSKYLDLARKSQAVKQAPSFIRALAVADRVSLTNQLLAVLDYAQDYGLELGSTVNTLDLQASKLLKDLVIYQRVYEVNEAHLVGSTPQEVVGRMNATITHLDAVRSLTESYAKLSPFLLQSGDMAAFIQAAPRGVSLIEDHAGALERVWDQLVLPSDTPSQTPPLERIADALSQIKASNIFSPTFFIIPESRDLKRWVASVGQVMTYNNVHELDQFVAHNSFISKLKHGLAENAGWIDKILIDANIDFETFAARIVNTLARATFQALPASERPIITQRFFSEYERTLKLQRKRHYIDGLIKIKSQVLGNARDLSNANNWPLASGSTMDKIRANTEMISRAYPIIIGTPKEVAKYLSPNKAIFDYVLFDEASQLLPGQALPAIYRAKKAVVIGDPHQMPPTKLLDFGGNTTASSEADEDELETSQSILDMVQALQPENQHHLKVHYRSESNLLFEPSRAAIYADDNIMPIFEAQMAAKAPISIRDNLGWGPGEAGEADKNFPLICLTMQESLRTDPDGTFCVLFTRADTLSSFQDFLTMEAADEYKELMSLYSQEKILLSTVTKCQGIEGKHSIVYFQHYEAPGAMWFFKENAGAYKRLNVSITRQTSALTILMADPKEKWLQTCESKLNNTETGPNTRKSAALLRSLLITAGEVPDTDYLDRHLSNNAYQFDSPLTEELYNVLCDKYRHRLGKDLKIYSEVGWHLLIPDTDNQERNKRNIGFRIDLGVYSLAQKRFVLGIEMDGAAYHTGFDKEHSDSQRQKVLETKGWKLHRIWSTNWLNNQQEELDTLIETVDKELAASTEAVQVGNV